LCTSCTILIIIIIQTVRVKLNVNAEKLHTNLTEKQKDKISYSRGTARRAMLVNSC